MGNTNSNEVPTEQSTALLRDNYTNINKTDTPTSEDAEDPIGFDRTNSLELLERVSMAEKIKGRKVLLHPYVAQVITRWEEHTETQYNIFGHLNQRKNSLLS